MTRLPIVLVALLGGCASFGYSGMSAEQIKAAAADKSFSAICETVSGIWGSQRFVYAQVDKGSVPNGDITVAPDCSIGMSNEAVVRSTAAPVKLTVPVSITPQLVK